MPEPNIPNTGQPRIRAIMRVKSFVSPENPSPKQLLDYDKEVNEFLDSIDNQKRFLNGRNSYSVDKKVYTLVWFLERVPEEPVATPFGDKVKEAQPVIKQDEQPINPETKKN